MAHALNGHSAQQELDPRLAFLTTAGLGLLVWRAGPVGVCLLLALALCLVARVGRGRPLTWRALTGGALFALFWALLTFLLLGFGLGEEVVSGLWPRLGLSALLGARLYCLVLLGLGLTSLVSSRRLGLGAASLARPVLGDRAWKLALSLALMVHFLPRVLACLGQGRRMLAMRAVRRPLHTRVALVLTGAVQSLARDAWNQTLALAARRLDRPEVWRERFDTPALQYALAALLLTGYAGLVWLEKSGWKPTL